MMWCGVVTNKKLVVIAWEGFKQSAACKLQYYGIILIYEWGCGKV